MHTRDKARGAAQKIIILVIVLLVAAALLGVIAYRQATTDNTTDNGNGGLEQTLANAECEHVSDEKLCKFFTSWEEAGHYTLNATSQQDGTTTTFVLRTEKENDAFHLQASNGASYETIAIGDTVYVHGDNGTWYEQTVAREKVDDYRTESNFAFREPTSEEEAVAITYTAEGEEACGDRSCYKYRVGDMTEEGRTMHIWFDSEAYRLRRIQVTGDNYTYDAAVSYDPVTVEAPSQTTALAEGEHIPPGQSQPSSATLPATGDQFDPEAYRQWLEQRGPNP